jgi:hypothetical protein
MKTVILSTNDNKDYLLYLPYVQKAWNNLGWKTLTFYLGNEKIKNCDKNKIIRLQHIEGYREATIVQVSRLFGAKYTEGLIMTSDVDMMPLSDYWNPDENIFSCYGSDLTNFKHHPICYIAAKQQLWNSLIPENSIQELLEKYPKAKSDYFNDWWYVDQEITTERIEKSKNRIILNRNFEGHLAYGRIDRDFWHQTKYSNTQKIDCHLPRPFNKSEVEEILFKYHNIK